MNDKVHFRMCIGCQEMMHKNKLLRICSTEKGIFVDKANKMGGRGAYICSGSCLKTAEKRKRLNRALKTAVPDEILRLLYKEFENE